MAFPHDWHRDVIADFAAAIRAGRPPAVPGRAALEVHRLIDALTLSAREGRASLSAASCTAASGASTKRATQIVAVSSARPPRAPAPSARRRFRPSPSRPR